MTRDKAESTVLKVIYDELGLAPEEVALFSTLADLDADSMDSAKLFVALEDEVGQELKISNISPQAVTVESIVKYLEQNVDVQPNAPPVA